MASGTMNSMNAKYKWLGIFVAALITGLIFWQISGSNGLQQITETEPAQTNINTEEKRLELVSQSFTSMSTNDAQSPQEISSQPSKETTQSLKTITTIQDIFESQEKVADALMAEQSSSADKESRFLDLMAPLGVLDPYATESSSRKDAAALMNQMFGWYGTKYGLSEDRILELVERPLSYAMVNFDVDDYFKQNKSILDDIYSRVNSDANLKILAFWSSGIERVNDTFNAEVGFWKQDKTSGDFIDLSNVKFADSNTQTESLTDSIATLATIQKMADINVTIAYKCSGRTILIMGATADNASGFIRNGNASDVNCGLLASRFDIIKELKLDGDWTFWVGR